MNLAELIRGKRNTDKMRPATAIPARVAILPTVQSELVPQIATIATIAIATPRNDDSKLLTTDRTPVPKAWLTESGELRTRGVFEDLAGEIIKLTVNDLHLQAKLLRECCGAYSGPQWLHFVEDWNERAAIMQYDGGLSRHDAEYHAAERLRLIAFLDELRGTL
ncbi:MAG: hypothetical protein WCP20_21470 [Desulfuromonadales bacterium]